MTCADSASPVAHWRNLSCGFSEMWSLLFGRDDKEKQVVGGKNKSLIEIMSISMCKYRGGKQSRPLQNIASSVDAPIIGHTSSPHRMHVAHDEK